MKHLSAAFQREQLHHAAQAGDLEAVNKWLLRKYPVNRFDEIGKTPLHYAVQFGHLPVVDRLLRAGANVNAMLENSICDTPLADNVERCSIEMVKRLLDAGANPMIPGWMQLTAMHRAEKREDSDAREIRQLLQQAAKKFDRRS